MKDPLPFRISPRRQRFQGQFSIKRLVVLGAHHLVEIISCRIRTWPVMSVETCYVLVALGGQVVSSADAKGTTNLHVSCWSYTHTHTPSLHIQGYTHAPMISIDDSLCRAVIFFGVTVLVAELEASVVSWTSRCSQINTIKQAGHFSPPSSPQ